MQPAIKPQLISSAQDLADALNAARKRGEIASTAWWDAYAYDHCDDERQEVIDADGSHTICTTLDADLHLAHGEWVISPTRYKAVRLWWISEDGQGSYDMGVFDASKVDRRDAEEDALEELLSVSSDEDRADIEAGTFRWGLIGAASVTRTAQ